MPLQKLLTVCFPMNTEDGFTLSIIKSARLPEELLD